MKKTSRFTLFYILLAILALFFIQRHFSEDTFQVAYSEFKDHLYLQHIKWVELGTDVTGKMLIPAADADKVPRPVIAGQQPRELPKGKEFSFATPRVEDPKLPEELQSRGVPFKGKQESEFSLY